MPSRFLSALGVALAVAASSSPALGACGQGKVPTYGDIGAIRYERTACVRNCPSYQVLFTNFGECDYVGRAHVPRHGTYRAICSFSILKRAIVVLEKHQFISINYVPILATDTSNYIVSVERCGVTTILDWPVNDDRQKDIESLLDGLDVITGQIRWHKVSDSLQSPLSQFASIP
jgi:hypothetical protein